MTTLPTWTDEGIAELTRLWRDEGLSLTQLGVRFGRTRNAVCGKLYRLGLMGPAAGRLPVRIPGRKPGQADSKPRPRPISGAALKSMMRRLKPPALRPPPLPPASAEPPTGFEKSLLELGAGDCHWPLTTDLPHLFCGGGVHAGCYCAHHYRKSIQRAA